MPICKWDNGGCVVKGCADQKSSSNCLIVLADGLTGFSLCKWDSATSTCAVADDDYTK